MSAELEDSFILLHDKKLFNVRELMPVLEAVAKAGKLLLIVAEEGEGDAPKKEEAGGVSMGGMGGMDF